MKNKLIDKIEYSALSGRGGAAYPVYWKWQDFSKSIKTKNEAYFIVNGAEGEPGVKKDEFILANHLDELINGIYVIDKYFSNKKIKKIYFYLNKDYLKKYKKNILTILKEEKYKKIKDKIEFFVKAENPGYISGEESAILNIIEGKKTIPRLKPPYPSTKGLFDKPTLVHNIETIYDISLVSKNKYQGLRFYYINGSVKKPGVYSFNSNMSIEEVLKESGNYPEFNFFVQVGGQASGEVLNRDQLFISASSTASIMVYNKEKTDQNKLIKYWLKFYQKESCGNCSVCREGTYRLLEMINNPPYDKNLFWDIVESLENTSFCALGSSLSIPLKTYYKNIINIDK